jgi:hypothetical protein
LTKYRGGLITVFRGVAGQSPAEGVAEDAVGG